MIRSADCPSTTADWSAQAKLDAKSYSTRNIWTFDAAVATTKPGVFTAANYATNAYFNKPHISTSPTGLTQFLCSSADICLSATNQDSSHGSGANLVNYLRGDRTHEGGEAENTKYFGSVHTCWAISSMHRWLYVTRRSTATDLATVLSRSNNASRMAMVYVAANDGMLHAFAAKAISHG